MNFDNPQVIELGLAEELIQDVPGLVNSENTIPVKTKIDLANYVAETE